MVHDDIIVSGASTEEHETGLQEVLKRARDRNIQFNKMKVQLPGADPDRINRIK